MPGSGSSSWFWLGTFKKESKIAKKIAQKLTKNVK